MENNINKQVKIDNPFAYTVIYVFTIPGEKHHGCLKIGMTTLHTNKSPDNLFPNCSELNNVAKKRIDDYTKTAGIDYQLLHAEVAIKANKEGKLIYFSDHDVHNVLKKSNIHFVKEIGREWFKTNLETIKNAINAVKENRTSLLPQETITSSYQEIIFRPEQEEAIKKTIKCFKTHKNMLWNAKMRFGKTLSALELIKRQNYKKTIIITHRPVVDEGWFSDFNKIFCNHTPQHRYSSRTKGEKLENLFNSNESFVYFASIQDLRGSKIIKEDGFDKNQLIFNILWDLVIIDEAHEGTTTELGKNVRKALVEDTQEKLEKTKVLELSGTPFKLLEDHDEETMYTWDYIMEQEAKLKWEDNEENIGKPNPYFNLPKLNIFTYDLKDKFKNLIFEDEINDKSFNFKEFFRTWTGDPIKDGKTIDNNLIGTFVHETDVKKFLDLLVTNSSSTNYPYSTKEYRDFIKHALWVVPGVKAANALTKILEQHDIFGKGNFKIMNVAGNEESGVVQSQDAINIVKKGIEKNERSITLTCGRLTTGVTVPEWTAVFYLAGTYTTEASRYLQTIFRVQSPNNENGQIKTDCYVFDFAPDRTLRMMIEACQLSAKKKDQTKSEKEMLNRLLNFLPVIGIKGSMMSEYNVTSFLEKIKSVYIDKVARNGFDNKDLYDFKTIKMMAQNYLTYDIEFDNLKQIVGSKQQKSKIYGITMNQMGLTNEERELEKKAADPSKKKELTPEELQILKERKEKRERMQKYISTLRAISIRFPLMVYGLNLKNNEEISIDNFTDLIEDETSWKEFMPVDKNTFKKFIECYDKEVFAGACKKIRARAKLADNLEPTNRVKELTNLFSTFKNPDKETVLTPWRVVNMHLGKTLGGYVFYDTDLDKQYNTPIKDNQDPIFIDNGEVTKETLCDENAQLLEINSKSGLYPLYLTYSLYRYKLNKIPKEKQTRELMDKIWLETVKNNIFVVCKTKMAKQITQRTLLGYKSDKINAKYFEDLINKFKEKSQQQEVIKKLKNPKEWKKEGKEMKFNAVVGNPPYQEQKGGTKNINVWHFFIYISTKLGKYTTMIHPARWLFPKKQMVEISNKIFKECGLFSFIYYANTYDIFKNVKIPEGMTFTLFKDKYSGPITDVIHNRHYDFKTEYLSNKYEEEIWKKLSPKILKVSSIEKRVFGNVGSLGSSEYGYNKESHINLLRENFDGKKNTYKIWATKDYGKASKYKWYWINTASLNIPNRILFSRKIMISKKGDAIKQNGKVNLINGKIQIVEKNALASGEVLFILPEKDKWYHLNLIKTMFETKTIRFLMSLTKKDLYTRGLENIPDYTYFIPSLNKKLFTDKFFYEKYNFSKELINYIESHISAK